MITLNNTYIIIPSITLHMGYQFHFHTYPLVPCTVTIISTHSQKQGIRTNIRTENDSTGHCSTLGSHSVARLVMVLTANMEKVVKHAFTIKHMANQSRTATSTAVPSKQVFGQSYGWNAGNWPVAFWLWHHLIVGTWHMYLCSHACTLHINCNIYSWFIMPAITNHWKFLECMFSAINPQKCTNSKVNGGEDMQGMGFPNKKKIIILAHLVSEAIRNNFRDREEHIPDHLV